MSRTVLVTGGAGYIGSHACKALARAGYLPVTLDNLTTGWRDAVKFGPFVQADLLDRPSLDAAFAEHKPAAVLHFAALSQVGEAMVEPGRYWRNNVGGSLNLIEAAIDAGCLDFVFSSTCATYGDRDGEVLDEDTPQAPLNAYGASKRAIEDMLKDFGASDGLRSVIFRYFNVAGADPDGEVGEFHQPETHLIPLILDAVDGKRAALTIHGTDYPTPDGTGVRDYVHVSDLADAHVAALRHILRNRVNLTMNCGYGWGYSVREVLTAVERVNGAPLPIVESPRRAGDPPSLVAAVDRLQRTLDWRPRYEALDFIIRSALDWEAALAAEKLS